MVEMEEESQKKQAQITLLRILAASPKSRQELEKKLLDKGYASAIVRETLDEFESKGLLSDKAYAQNLVARFVHAQPSGMRKISFELKRHGIPTKIREEVLNQLRPDEELERAREIAVSRWERFKNMDVQKRRKRIYDFLLRRGFEFQTARDLVEELEGNAKR